MPTLRARIYSLRGRRHIETSAKMPLVWLAFYYEIKENYLIIR